MHIYSPGTWWWRQEDSRASLLPSKFQASWLTQDLYNIKNKRGKVWETCLGAFLVPLPADFCGLDVFGIAAADLDEIRFSFSPVAPKGFLPFPVFLVHAMRHSLGSCQGRSAQVILFLISMKSLLCCWRWGVSQSLRLCKRVGGDGLSHCFCQLQSIPESPFLSQSSRAMGFISKFSQGVDWKRLPKI